MEKLQYCYRCGKEKIEKELSTFDSDTGKKRTCLICPNTDTVDCIHNHDYKDNKQFFFKKYDFQCTKCGDKGYYRCW